MDAKRGFYNSRRYCSVRSNSSTKRSRTLNNIFMKDDAKNMTKTLGINDIVPVFSSSARPKKARIHYRTASYDPLQ